MAKEILKMRNISKTFSGVKVLHNVNFNLDKGEVHILIGENGAGKSTLMKILAGIHPMDRGGVIELSQGKDGELEKVDIDGPRTAQELGISMVFQESNLIDNISIAENIYLGREPIKNGVIDWEKMYNNTKEQLKKVKCEISPKTIVSQLSVAEKQIVEIAKSLSFDARIIILDEPTSSLSDREVDLLFELIRDLKKHGVSIIYISHRMQEIFTIGDRITVFRDGEWINTVLVKDTTEKELVKMMIGRKLEEDCATVNHKKKNEVILEANNITIANFKEPMSMKLHKGEILGIFGLVGAGRTEFAKILFGLDSIGDGEIIKNGKKIEIKGPGDAVANGIGLVPEDRKKLGFIKGMSVRNNLSLVALRYLKPILMTNNAEKSITEDHIKKLSIATRNQEQPVEQLSGGNQQKVVLSKWLAANPDILILDEPTRGVDVGARADIYELMRQLANDGMSIIMISSDLPEILRVSERVLVMHDGRITLDDYVENLNQEIIMHAAIS